MKGAAVAGRDGREVGHADAGAVPGEEEAGAVLVEKIGARFDDGLGQLPLVVAEGGAEADDADEVHSLCESSGEEAAVAHGRTATTRASNLGGSVLRGE